MTIRTILCLLLIGVVGCSKSNDTAKTSSPAPQKPELTSSPSPVKEPEPAKPAPESAQSAAPQEVEDEVVKHFNAGNDYSKKGDFPKAIEAYEKAIAINRTIANIHYNLANVYVANAAGKNTQTDYEKAVKEYQTAIELSPLSPEYHRNLGYAYALQKRGDLAKNKYEELKKMSPPHAEELLNWINRDNQKK